MTELYIPPGAISLDKITTLPQIRLGEQGFPGTGKTYSALTFPNVIVFNLDRGLGAHTGRADILEIPAWNQEYLKTINKAYKSDVDLKDTIEMWLDKEARKLYSNQTLVFDGGTKLQAAYNSWLAENRPVTKSGDFDEFAPWRLKIVYFETIMGILGNLNCHVIYISHEAEKSDKGGGYTGKIRPLLTGQFADQLLSHFTDWFRQHAVDKLPEDKIDDKVLKMWGMTKKEFIEMQNSYPRNTIYCWQTSGDNIFDGKCSSLVNYPSFMPANYDSFCKYRRKLCTT